MAASRLDNSGLFQPFVIQAEGADFALPPEGVRIRKNGIEFRSPKSFPAWREMTVTLQSPNASRKLKCSGVVVACDGSRHAGYTVSLLFLSLSRQAQADLNQLADSHLSQSL